MNNFGIGVDIEHTERFEKYDSEENKKFLEKIFTKKELEYCYSKKDSAQHLTARFCGKEAVVKALDKFTKTQLVYTDIEILNDASGAPHVTLQDESLRNIKIEISLSHAKDTAIAFVLVHE